MIWTIDRVPGSASAAGFPLVSAEDGVGLSNTYLRGLCALATAGAATLLETIGPAPPGRLGDRDGPTPGALEAGPEAAIVDAVGAAATFAGLAAGEAAVLCPACASVTSLATSATGAVTGAGDGEAAGTGLLAGGGGGLIGGAAGCGLWLSPRDLSKLFEFRGEIGMSG